MWRTYKVVNDSLRRCYIGVTEGEVRAQISKDSIAAGNLSDWDFRTHRIKWRLLKSFPDETAARRYAREKAERDQCFEIVRKPD